MRTLFLCVLFLTGTSVSAQKIAYVPAYLLDTNTVDGQQFSWSKTAQSDNFLIIWGDSAGLDPTVAPHPDLVFDPALVLDTMETIFSAFISFGFAQDEPGTSLGQYKIPIIMLNTFGPAGVTGWAFGGDIDGVVGAFWAHPIAMQSGHVAAHEFAHSMQAQSVIDYRSVHGLGPVWIHAGIFWETHANFMRNLLYPQDVTAWGMDMYHVETWGDWKNTYENYQLLMAIMEADGIDIINRMWRESFSEEYPLQAYKRLMGYDQSAFNDKMYEYARRMAAFDFNYNNVGSYFRQYRANDLMYWLPTVQAVYTILEQDPQMHSHYRVPVELAPEEFAYNIIPLYPHPDSCALIIKFKGHLDANAHAGWRYGFVAVDAEGVTTRYSDTYTSDNAEVMFSLMPGEENVFFVVMGAPDVITTGPSNDTWHGYPKHFRFPYELTISGGFPEGSQPASQFRSQLRTNGHLHVHGGGWIDNASTVDASVYVGPHAIVLGNSSISGDVRIENSVLVNNATISGNVLVADNAFVIGGSLSGNSVVRGQAFVENAILEDSATVHMRARVSNYRLHGNVEVGGDVIVYNASGDCDNGVHYRMTNYYADNLLECDGRTADHPANLDVNNIITPFSNNEMTLSCNCVNYPGCLTTGINVSPFTQQFGLYPNPASNSITLDTGGAYLESLSIRLFNVLGECVLTKEMRGSVNPELDISRLRDGIYSVLVTQNDQILKSGKLVIGATHP